MAITSPLHTSVVIVGAGPAGCSASTFLSKAGIAHVIIEKETFPRDKVCGDACSGKTVSVLRKANPEWLSEIFAKADEFSPAKGITFIAPNGKPIDIPFPHELPAGESAGFTVPRLHFDNFLFEKLDTNFATVLQGAAIKTLTQKDGVHTISVMHEGLPLEITTPMIIGADGDKGIVRKTLMKQHAPEKAYSVGLRAYYKNVGDIHPERFLELHFLPEVLPGYLWVFPLPDGQCNVGIGMLSDLVRKKKMNLREKMLDVLQNHPKFKGRFEKAELHGKIMGWGLPMCNEKLPVSGDGFVLVGDAAALIDPFTGEGIGNALYSGMLAGEAAIKAIENGKYSAGFFKQTYDNILYRGIGEELQISTALQRLSSYPWLFNFLVNKAYKSASLKETISCMFTDLNMRDRLQRPSFYFKILFNR